MALNHVLGIRLGAGEQPVGGYRFSHYDGRQSKLILTNERLILAKADDSGCTTHEEFFTSTITKPEIKFSDVPVPTTHPRKRRRFLPIFMSLLFAVAGGAILYFLIHDVFYRDNFVVNTFSSIGVGFLWIVSIIFLIFALLPNKPPPPLPHYGNFTFELYFVLKSAEETTPVKLTCGKPFNILEPKFCLRLTSECTRLVNEFGACLMSINWLPPLPVPDKSKTHVTINNNG